MKTKKVALLALLPSLFALSMTGCKGEEDQPGSLPDNVTVNFYIDFNQVDSGETYYTVTIGQGERVNAPDKPTEAPFEEFPVFIGWSDKEIVNSTNDLWDFNKNTITSKTGTCALYGIWVAEGEA